jgi:hypothetical protein
MADARLTAKWSPWLGKGDEYVRGIIKMKKRLSYAEHARLLTVSAWNGGLT